MRGVLPLVAKASSAETWLKAAGKIKHIEQVTESVILW